MYNLKEMQKLIRFSKIPFQLIKNDEKLNKLIFESLKEIIETSKLKGSSNII